MDKRLTYLIQRRIIQVLGGKSRRIDRCIARVTPADHMLFDQLHAATTLLSFVLLPDSLLFAGAWETTHKQRVPLRYHIQRDSHPFPLGDAGNKKLNMCQCACSKLCAVCGDRMG